jgi:hypothetical protein
VHNELDWSISEEYLQKLTNQVTDSTKEEWGTKSMIGFNLGS